MNMMIRRLLLAATLVVWSASLSVAQEAPGEIVVIGMGHVSARPDVARISLGVDIEEETAGMALDGMAAALTRVFEQLDTAGIAPEDRQTTRLNLNPQYVQEQRDGRPTRVLSGYRASSLLTVRVPDVSAAGALIDQLTTAGANRIDAISFELSNPRAAQAQARRLAVADAERRARTYAKAAGLELGGVMSISETGPRPMPGMLRMDAPMAEAAASIPVAEGSVEVEARVTVVFAISVDETDGE
ncbi:MAG: SIMPL domain-containing protein [Pseudomonadota bacterium]